MNKMSGVALSGVMPILMVLLVQYAEAQTTYVVGNGTGWRIPPEADTYQNWASDKNFTVGDILTFNFQTGQHNVIQVSEGSYNSCSSANPINSYNSGPVNITLDRGGQHYYICGVGQHCNNGQRLAITVSGSSTALPPASTTLPPPSISSSATSSFLPFLSLSLSLSLSAFIIHHSSFLILPF